MDIPREKLVQNCPIQKKCEWTFKYYSTFNSYKLPVFRCNTCGLETIHTDESIEYEKLYGGEYYKGGSEYTYRDERETEKFDAYVWDARIQNIQKFIKTGNFLDVGCSFGGFLSRAKLKGFQVYGVEVSEYSAEYAKKRGIEVFQGNFLNSNFEKESFDVITLVEVIEHLE
ncbi:MAG: class I SAM-dependent methyltransferase, partial [Leptospiraceae bacterium]|nr:class I SAM-dependent methyltransferase [Leptospiraceae bacterium]